MFLAGVTAGVRRSFRKGTQAACTVLAVTSTETAPQLGEGLLRGCVPERAEGVTPELVVGEGKLGLNGGTAGGAGISGEGSPASADPAI